MRTNPRIEAAAGVLAAQWCTHPDQLEDAMKVTRRDAAALERAGLLANPKDTP